MELPPRLSIDELGVSLSLAAAGHCWSPRHAVPVAKDISSTSSRTTTAAATAAGDDRHDNDHSGVPRPSLSRLSLGPHPTLVTLEISPMSTDQDLPAWYHSNLITNYATINEGDSVIQIRWGEHCHRQPVAFGIERLVCTFSVREAAHADAVLRVLSLQDGIQSIRVTSMTPL